MLKIHFKKAVSSFLILSQLVWIVTAQADFQNTPETNLLGQIITLQGAGLSASAAQAQVQSLVTTYLSEATVDGQQQRFQEALVDLGIYTPTQADTILNGLIQATAQTKTTNDLAQAMSSEVSQLANLNPTGAEFSRCVVGGTIELSSFVLAPIAAYLNGHNPTCTTTDTRRGEVQTCTQSGYHPDRPASYGVWAATGVAFVAGLVVLLTGDCS